MEYQLNFASVKEIMAIKPSAENARHSSVVTNYAPAISSWRSVTSSWRYWFGPGFTNMDQIIHTINNGWPDGAARIMKALSQVDLPRVRSVRRQKRRSDFGDHLDIQRVYAGDLEHAWTRTDRVDGSQTIGRNVLIACNIGGRADLSAEALFWRGAVTVRLAELCAVSGRNVEIYAYNKCSGFPRERDQVFTSVLVKRYSEPVDVERLAAVVALPAFFRYAIFKARLSIKVHGDQFDIGGTMYDPTITAESFGVAPSTTVLNISNVFDQEAAVELMKSLSEQVLTLR